LTNGTWEGGRSFNLYIEEVEFPHD
jgi:hypothetical protein